MSEPVPVADHLLESTLYGLPVRRLLEAIGLPVVPGLFLYALQPLLGLSFPVVAIVGLGGVLGGLYVFSRTPSGQSPLAWTLARLRFATRPTTYVWDPQIATVRAATSTLPIRDDWLTTTVDSNASPETEP